MSAIDLAALLELAHPQFHLTSKQARALVRVALAARNLREWGTVLADERIGYETVQVDVVDRIELDAALDAVFGSDG